MTTRIKYNREKIEAGEAVYSDSVRGLSKTDSTKHE